MSGCPSGRQCPTRSWQILQSTAESDGGVLSLDDALSALRMEMTDDVVDQTRAFWSERNVNVEFDVDPEVDPEAVLAAASLEQIVDDATDATDSRRGARGAAVLEVESVVEEIGDEPDDTDGMVVSDQPGDPMGEFAVQPLESPVTPLVEASASVLTTGPGARRGPAVASPSRWRWWPAVAAAAVRRIRCGMYLREIGKVPLLDAAEEVALAKRIEAGVLAEDRARRPQRLR